MIEAFGGKAVNWYITPDYWPFILIFIYLWKHFGYNSILYYATVIGIDTSLYEAAAIDGAGKWKQVWHITLPGLKTTIITLVLLAVGRMFFSDTIDVYVYKALLQLNDIGRSAAAGFVQSALGFILIVIVNKIVRKVDEESALF